MTEETNDEDWVESEFDKDSVELATENDSAGETSNPVELIVAEKLAVHKIALVEEDLTTVTLTPHSRLEQGLPFNNTRTPKGCLAALANQLDRDPIHAKRWRGIIIPSLAYIEVALSSNTSFLRRPLEISMSKLSVEESSQCTHEIVQDEAMSSFMTNMRNRRSGATPISIHVAGPMACIEISPPSPAFHVLCNEGMRVPRYTISVKLFFSKFMTAADLEDAAEPLIDSFLYELNVRNNVRARTERWPIDSNRTRRAYRPTPISNTVRFPTTRVEAEVAVLFGFAGSAADNPPLAYLSYYQVLENFLPLAGRRAALRSLRLELADPRFDHNQDRYLMRLMNIGQDAATSSESRLLRILIEDFVRGDKLEQFFIDANWGSHFKKQGPIRGMQDNINIQNTQDPLAQQVAGRVYAIRNRIVHVKDDPKYASIPPLLPQSDEAESLWPDIELVKFLCEEVIIGTQNIS